MRRAVFLDRDGTISRTAVRDGRPHAPTCLEEFAILPEAPEQLRRLRDAGLLLIVVTNQPDVARGKVARDDVETMHRRLKAELFVDDVEACYETEDEGSGRYKPAPGMLLDAARRHGVALDASFMIGDRWRDVGAGRAAGCYSVFIDRGYRERKPDSPDAVVGSLTEAVDRVLSIANRSPA